MQVMKENEVIKTVKPANEPAKNEVQVSQRSESILTKFCL